MTVQSLNDYIKKALEQGISKEQIIQELLKAGWDQTIIDEELNIVTSTKNLPIGKLLLVFISATIPTIIVWWLIEIVIRQIDVCGKLPMCLNPFFIPSLVALAVVHYFSFKSAWNYFILKTNTSKTKLKFIWIYPLISFIIVNMTGNAVINFQFQYQLKQEQKMRQQKVADGISDKKQLQEQMIKTANEVSIEASETIDYKGVVYPTVKIGNQIWLAKSLNIDNQERCWNSKEGVYECGSYTWSATMNLSSQSIGYEELVEPVQGICPDGWHIPSNKEFGILEQALVNNNNCDVERKPQIGNINDDKYFCQSVGDYLKIKDFCFLKENCNKTLFSLYLDEFGYDGLDTSWDEAHLWTSTQFNDSLVLTRRISSLDAGISVSVRTKNDSRSQVRCIKNSE